MDVVGAVSGRISRAHGGGGVFLAWGVEKGGLGSILLRAFLSSIRGGRVRRVYVIYSHRTSTSLN